MILLLARTLLNLPVSRVNSNTNAAAHVSGANYRMYKPSIAAIKVWCHIVLAIHVWFPVRWACSYIHFPPHDFNNAQKLVVFGGEGVNSGDVCIFLKISGVMQRTLVRYKVSEAIASCS